MSNEVATQLRSDVARIAANMAGLAAYQYQQRDPRHIAAAWLEFRRFRLVPDEGMLRWVDRLAGEVLTPTSAGTRPKENAVRDLEIYRLVHVHLEKGTKLADAYADVAKQFRLTVKNVQVIVGRVGKSLVNPYDEPRAFK